MWEEHNHFSSSNLDHLYWHWRRLHYIGKILFLLHLIFCISHPHKGKTTLFRQLGCFFFVSCKCCGILLTLAPYWSRNQSRWLGWLLCGSRTRSGRCNCMDIFVYQSLFFYCPRMSELLHSFWPISRWGHLWQYRSNRLFKRAKNWEVCYTNLMSDLSLLLIGIRVDHQSYSWGQINNIYSCE